MNDRPRDVRRMDRQVTDEAFLRQLLRESPACTIAVEDEAAPHILATFFVYDESAREVIFHFSKYGRGGEVITTGKKASVCVYKYGKLYTARRAVDFGGEYQSVIIYGSIRIVDDQDERMSAMSVFFDKFFKRVPTSEYEAFTAEQAEPIHVAKIKIEKWVGKQHLVPDGAFQSFYPLFDAVI